MGKREKEGRGCAGDFAKLLSLITYPCNSALILHKREPFQPFEELDAAFFGD
jgi:hypothetical protein